MSVNNKIIRAGAILGGLAVILGAFGAHGLKELVDEKSLANWETASRYQFYHALALVFTGILFSQNESGHLRWAFRFFLIGIILFCGSLYVLSLRNLLSVNVLYLGPVTPAGGVSFILGWLSLALNKFSKNSP